MVVLLTQRSTHSAPFTGSWPSGSDPDVQRFVDSIYWEQAVMREQTAFAQIVFGRPLPDPGLPLGAVRSVDGTNTKEGQSR